MIPPTIARLWEGPRKDRTARRVRKVGGAGITPGGTARQVREWIADEDRTRWDEPISVNTGQHIRVQAHNPWVVGSSPTRPTEVGHPTRRLNWWAGGCGRVDGCEPGPP